MINELALHNSELLYEIMDVNEAYKYLYEILIKAIERSTINKKGNIVNGYR